MRSPVRIRVAAPDNPEGNTSGLWFFISLCKLCKGIFCFSGLTGVATLASQSGSANGVRQNPVRIPEAEIWKLAFKAKSSWYLRLWIPGAAPAILAAARSRSGENNTQVFSNTLAPLRYPEGNTSGLWFFISLCKLCKGIFLYISYMFLFFLVVIRIIDPLHKQFSVVNPIRESIFD